MSTFYAQPYDTTASGFYFTTMEEYEAGVVKARNEAGLPVEEFEIQFIDGDSQDAALAEAWGLSQANLRRLIEAVEEWEYHSKVRLIIARECGIDFDVESDDIDLLDVEICGAESLRELAEDAVESGWFGVIPEELTNYIDYDAIARDLAMDYAVICVAGEHHVYRCG